MTWSSVSLVVMLALGTAGGNGGRKQNVYRYTEPDGTVVYTNVLPSGPGAATAKRLRQPTAPELATTRTPRAAAPHVFAAFDEAIDRAARRYKVPAHLLRAVMHTESAFQVTAVSPKGASGLMQLMPGTAAEMYVKDIFNAEQNIEGGARYLRVLANEFEGDMVKMVAAYNAGPEAVRKYGGKVPPYPETRDYVRKVLKLYFEYKAQANGKEQASGTAEAP